MRPYFSIIVAVFIYLFAAGAQEAEARCGLFGRRCSASFQPFNGRFRAAARSVVSRSYAVQRVRPTASGCESCRSHGVGPDGFRLK